MLLLFLLTFNSASTLGDEDFYIREETSKRLSVLSVAAWPSLLLANCGDSAEVHFRCYSLLQPLRKLELQRRAIAILDSGWPSSVAEAESILNNLSLWIAIADEVSVRAGTAAVTAYLRPSNTFWDHVNQTEYMRQLLKQCRSEYSWNKPSCLLP